MSQKFVENKIKKNLSFPCLEKCRSFKVWKFLNPTKEVISTIASKIGNLFYLDDGSLGHLDMKTAWFFIERNLSRGLLAKVNLFLDPCSQREIIDHWGFHFCCLCCHKTGHILTHCPNHLRWGSLGGRPREAFDEKHNQLHSKFGILPPLLSPKFSSIPLINSMPLAYNLSSSTHDSRTICKPPHKISPMILLWNQRKKR